MSLARICPSLARLTSVLLLLAVTAGLLSCASHDGPGKPPTPVITSFKAGGNPIPAGAATTLTALFTGGTGTLDHGLGNLASGVAHPTGVLRVSTPFTLTVDNGAGAQVTSTLTVKVQDLVLGSILPAMPRVAPGGHQAFSVAVTGGNTNQVVWSSTGGSWTGNTWTAPAAIGPQTLTATSVDDPARAASLTVNVEDVVLGPILPALATVAAGASQTFTVSVTGGTWNTVTWSATGGSWAGNTWTAPMMAGPQTLTATSVDDPTRKATLAVRVVEKPNIVDFHAVGANLAMGSGTQLVAFFSGGAGTVDHGLGSIVSGVPLATGILKTSTAFTLTVDNGAGTQVTSTLTVNVQDLALGPILPALATVVAGASQTFTVAVTGGIWNTVTWSATGGSWEGNTWTAPTVVGPQTLTATSVDDPARRATLTIRVVDKPGIADFHALGANLLVGSSTQLAATFSGGTGTVDHGLGRIISGVPLATGILKASTTYTLTVDNGAGTQVTSTLTVSVRDLVFGPIYPSPATVVVGEWVDFQVGVAGGVSNKVTWSCTSRFFKDEDTWIVPDLPGLQTITATSVDDPDRKVSLSIMVVDGLPTITYFDAGGTIDAGDGADLIGKFTGGAGIIEGLGPLRSGFSRTTPPVYHDRSYTLTVSNGKGDVATATGTVKVRPVTIGPVLPVVPTMPAGAEQTFTCLVTGTMYPYVTWSSTGGSWVGNTWTAPQEAGPQTITATFGTDIVTQTVMVVTGPYILAFAADKSVITVGHGTNLTISAIRGSASIEPGIGPVGNETIHVTPAATTTYTLTVRDGALSTTKSLTVEVVDPPVIDSFVAHPSIIKAGESCTLMGVFRNGVGTVDPGIGAVQSGTEVVAGPHGDSQTYTLMVTNLAGDRVEAEAGTVIPNPGSFSATGPMASAREGSTLTPLPNSLVLVAGGTGPTGVAATAELFDARKGMFLATGTMKEARTRHTATLLPNGEVLVTGGQGTSTLATAERYNLATGVFTPTGAMVAARMDHAASLLANGKVLVTGGLNGSGDSLYTAELYDPDTGTFSPAENLLMGRSHHTSTRLPNGQVLIAGGSGDKGPLAEAELFSQDTYEFTSTADLASARSGHTATLLRTGGVLVAGGDEGGSAEIFFYTSGRWKTTGSLVAPGGRRGHAAALLPNGAVLVAGGEATGSAEVYYPAAGAFALVAPMVKARSGLNIVPLWNGQLLLTGGRGPGGPLAEAECFDAQDPAQGVFSPAGTMITTRGKPTATLLPDGNVLIAGGVTSEDVRPPFAELFDPVQRRFRPTGSMLTPRDSHSATLLASGKVLLVGGYAYSYSRCTSGAEIYDPVSQTFTQTGSMPVCLDTQNAILLGNGKVLISGDNSNEHVNYVMLFDPATETFKEIGSNSYNSNYGHSIAILLPTGKVLIGQGTRMQLYDPTLETLAPPFADLPKSINGAKPILLPNGIVGFFDFVYSGESLYDPWANTWTFTDHRDSMPHEARKEMVLLRNGDLLSTGGDCGSCGSSSSFLYSWISDSWRPTGRLSVGRLGPCVILLADRRVLVVSGQTGDWWHSYEKAKWAGTAEIY